MQIVVQHNIKTTVNFVADGFECLTNVSVSYDYGSVCRSRVLYYQVRLGVEFI